MTASNQQSGLTLSNNNNKKIDKNSSNQLIASSDEGVVNCGKGILKLNLF